MSGHRSAKAHAAFIPPAVLSMTLAEIAVELLEDRLLLEQAHEALRTRPCLTPSWRPGDALPGSPSAAQAPSRESGCPNCGRAYEAPIANGDSSTKRPG